MEEQAELQLLEQRLQQTNQLAGRMAGLLSQLDSRLSRLDKTIAPFGIQNLTREASNLDAALALLDGTKVTTEILKADPSVTKNEHQTLSRMPDSADWQSHAEAINRVVKDIERLAKADLRSSEAQIRDLTRVVDTGIQNLLILFQSLCKSGQWSEMELDRVIQSGPVNPQESLSTFQSIAEIAAFIQSLPHYPEHPCSSSVQSAFQSARETFIASRRDFVVDRGVKPVVKTIQTLTDSPGREDAARREKAQWISKLVQALMVTVETEGDMLDQLFPPASPPALASIFSTPTRILQELLTSQINVIKKSLESNAFYALDLYRVLHHLQPRWQDTINQFFAADEDMGKIVVEGTAALRQACLRSFPELLVDVRTSTRAKDSSLSSVADITYSVVSYLETLPTYEDTVISLLNHLGDRNWLMGAQPSTKLSAQESDGDGILQHYITDLLSALVTSLDTSSRSPASAASSASRKPIVSSIFMLNNLSYMRNNLILSSQSSASDILGTTAQDLLNAAYRDAKAHYLDSWRDLVGLLADTSSSSGGRFGNVVQNVGGGGDKQTVKDSLANFFTRLDELDAVSRQHTLSRKDPQLRERLQADVKNLVVAAFQSYAAKHPKHVEKYSRSSAAELEARLTALVR